MSSIGSASPTLDPAHFDESMNSIASSSRAGTGGRRGGGRRARAASSSAGSVASQSSAQPMGDSLGDELGGTLGDELAAGGESLADQLGAGGAGALGDELAEATQQDDQPHQAAVTSEESETEQDIELQTRTMDANHAKAEASLAESVSATSTFLASLRSLSSAATSSSKSAGQDTAALESVAATFVRQLRSSAAERESQVRELREITREFAREDVARGLAASAAAADDNEAELPTWDVDVTRDTLGLVGDTAAPASKALNGIQEAESDEEDSEVPRTLASLPTPSPNAPASEQLAHLRASTADLLGSISSLSEHAQVSRAATSDAARRLRALRGVLGGWKAEHEGVAASRAWIESYESSATSGSGVTGGADVKSWTASQMERAERLLSEASGRARELLQPPRCEAMDRLVDELPAGALDRAASMAKEQVSVRAGA